MYHTQEKWEKPLLEAETCYRDDAWLGEAKYYWYSEDDAIFWGLKSKRRTGYYEIYIADVDCSNILDTVFNESHYLFWIRQIEKVAKIFLTRAREKPTLKELNDYFKDKGIWTKFDGILFQDISNNPDHYYVFGFPYKKRIQLAVYNNSIITNFGLHFVGQCV